MPLRRLLLAAALVAALTACGDDDDAEVVSEEDPSSPDADMVSMTVAFDQPPSEEDVDATTAVILRRLDGLGVGDATIEGEDGELVLRFPASASIDPIDVRGVVEESGDLAFRPVLQMVPPEAAPECRGPDGPLHPQHADGGEIVQCYELGPADVTGAIVRDASAVQQQVGWAISLELHPGAEGLAPFNQLTPACFDRTAACPTGQLAIVLDGEVMSAPTIQQPTFDEQGVSIVGDFSQSEAEALAVVLRSGALPVAITVVDVEEPR